MKKLVTIITLLITFMSCKKDGISGSESGSTIPIPIWPDQCIGNYSGTWTSQSYGPPPAPGPLYSQDTTIVIGVGPSDSTLTTTLSNCLVIHYHSSSYQNGIGIYHGKIIFKNDSMYYNCMNGGLGSGNKETFKGKKL